MEMTSPSISSLNKEKASSPACIKPVDILVVETTPQMHCPLNVPSLPVTLKCNWKNEQKIKYFIERFHCIADLRNEWQTFASLWIVSEDWREINCPASTDRRCNERWRPSLPIIPPSSGYSLQLFYSWILVLNLHGHSDEWKSIGTWKRARKLQFQGARETR